MLIQYSSRSTAHIANIIQSDRMKSCQYFMVFVGPDLHPILWSEMDITFIELEIFDLNSLSIWEGRDFSSSPMQDLSLLDRNIMLNLNWSRT